jgi:hypothetical protein
MRFRVEELPDFGIMLKRIGNATPSGVNVYTSPVLSLKKLERMKFISEKRFLIFPVVYISYNGKNNESQQPGFPFFQIGEIK